MSPAPSLPELSLEALCDASQPPLVLCATLRQVQDLRRRQAELMQARGLQQWPALSAFVLDDWLQRWREERLLRGVPADHPFMRRVLDGVQERLLWEQVIRQNLGKDIEWLFDVVALARSAQEAHALMEAWQLNVPSALQGHETSRFLEWRHEFLARSKSQQWIDATRLRLSTWHDLVAHAGQLPQHWVLAGFLSFEPIEQHALEALQGRGIRLQGLAACDAAAAPQVESLPDPAAELLAAALWVRDELKAQPAARLALVVPDLAAQRDRIQDALDEVLMPSAFSPSQAEAARQYNLSLGRPLSQHAVVASALALLSLVWLPGRVAQTRWSTLLRDPLWSAHDREGLHRAHFEAWLRRKRSAQLALESVIKAGEAFSEEKQRRMPALQQHLQQMLLARQLAPALPSVWATRLPALIEACGGWAGRSLSSHEYQAREALLELIERLGSLDDFLGPLDGAAMLSQLRRLCRDRIFQPRTEGEPQVQVLGLLEASGQRFDGLRVIGLTDAAWPPPARPNPLLPASLQRQAGTPNAGAAVQLAFARAVQQSLLQAAPQVVLSWPRADGATEFGPSPLLLGFASTEREAPASPHWAQSLIQLPDRFEPPQLDAQAPPVAPGEEVPGGTSLLKAQAICPAWAYFQYRLGAQALQQATEGLDASERGNLVHQLLCKVWEALRDQAGLAQRWQDAAGFREFGRSMIEQVLDAFENQDSGSERLGPQGRQLEAARLERLLRRWCELEVARPVGFTVEAREQEFRVEIEGIKVKLIIDRIDRLHTGGLLVIDYKTGQLPKVDAWLQDRITEPQLPIYASLVDAGLGEPVVAVALAAVQLREPGFKGLASEPDRLRGLTVVVAGTPARGVDASRFPDWAAVQAHWQTSLRAVAHEVMQGQAAMWVNDEAQLRYCEMLPLLRLPEWRNQTELGGVS